MSMHLKLLTDATFIIPLLYIRLNIIIKMANKYHTSPDKSF